MKMYYFFKYGAVLVLLLIGSSCQKEWLDVKPNKSLVVPLSVEDYQAILDNTSLFNVGHPALGVVSADEYYLDYALWSSSGTIQERNCYVWNDEIYEGETKNYDWNPAFKRILYANIVIEGLNKLNYNSESEKKELSMTKGRALFHRSLSLFNLSQLFCPPYNQENANKPGIPLRLKSNVIEKVDRSTVAQTYEQILIDLKEALTILPDLETDKTRPSKHTAYSLLARVAVAMSDYDKALEYSNSALNVYSDLLDFNELSVESQFPFEPFNKEMIFYYTLNNYGIVYAQNYHVDTLLYSSYDSFDLRKSLFFNIKEGKVKFKGSYTGSNAHFGGISVGELLLIRAECFARQGLVENSLNDLNLLLKKRFKAGEFIPYEAMNKDELIDIVLQERRKELVFRGLRWSDLRRLNYEANRQVTLKRVMNDKEYVLLPNENKYTLPIAPNEIKLGGLRQNER